MSFADSYTVFCVSVADLKNLKINMKIKIRCFRVLLLPNKNRLTGPGNGKKTTRHYAHLSLCAKSWKSNGGKSRK